MYRILCLLLFPVLVYGQTAQEVVKQKQKITTERFQKNDENDFVVATPYIKNYVGINGSPFWATEFWSSADVLFKGKIYQLSQLKYDCLNDLMVIPRYTDDGVTFLNLIPSFYPEIYINVNYRGNQRVNVTSEQLFKREHFIYYQATKDEKNDGVLSGYYHYTIEKRISLLCKSTSSIIDRNGQKAFEEEEKYFFQKTGSYCEYVG